MSDEKLKTLKRLHKYSCPCQNYERMVKEKDLRVEAKKHLKELRKDYELFKSEIMKVYIQRQIDFINEFFDLEDDEE